MLSVMWFSYICPEYFRETYSSLCRKKTPVYQRYMHLYSLSCHGASNGSSFQDISRLLHASCSSYRMDNQKSMQLILQKCTLVLQWPVMFNLSLCLIVDRVVMNTDPCLWVKSLFIFLLDAFRHCWSWKTWCCLFFSVVLMINDQKCHYVIMERA